MMEATEESLVCDGRLTQPRLRVTSHPPPLYDTLSELGVAKRGQHAAVELFHADEANKIKGLVWLYARGSFVH
jgi:hypothetical protein